MVVHTHNSRTGETKARGFWVSGWPMLCRDQKLQRSELKMWAMLQLPCGHCCACPATIPLSSALHLDLTDWSAQVPVTNIPKSRWSVLSFSLWIRRQLKTEITIISFQVSGYVPCWNELISDLGSHFKRCWSLTLWDIGYWLCCQFLDNQTCVFTQASWKS